VITAPRWGVIPPRKTILDLCGGTGAWSDPYRQYGYEVYVVDPDINYRPQFLMTVQEFLAHVQGGTVYLPRLEGILAAPPCTHFTLASSRLWKTYDRDGRYAASLDIVDACDKIIDILSPRWWALENPPGRLSHVLGRPAWFFQPFEYGDPWSKETWIWGTATKPPPTNIVRPVAISPNQRLGGSSAKVKTERSRTPRGFAEAFAAINRRHFPHGNHS
jgi:hypothetical protein